MSNRKAEQKIMQTEYGITLAERGDLSDISCGSHGGTQEESPKLKLARENGKSDTENQTLNRTSKVELQTFG